jgi:hypothetical protein
MTPNQKLKAWLKRDRIWREARISVALDPSDEVMVRLTYHEASATHQQRGYGADMDEAIEDALARVPE